MRSYIFTERERRIVKAFLAGEKVSRLEVAKIRHRVRKFSVLAADANLYLDLRRRLAEPEPAAST